MDRRKYYYIYANKSTGTCWATQADTADPTALVSRMGEYLLIPATPRPTTGAELAAQMAQNQGFVQQVEAGWSDLEKGRVSSLEDVKRRLGGV